jgi:hypothetical protein
MSQRLRNIVRHYKNWKANHPDTWVEHCVHQHTLNDAINQAALSVDHNGKKHPHQYRLKNQTLSEFADNLNIHRSEISHAASFETLIQIVRDCRINGIGELAVYDTAVRIGAYLNLSPQRIYLHAGARVGADALIPGNNSDIIEKHQLPLEFQSDDLSCYELEDMLCIYKRNFIRSRN